MNVILYKQIIQDAIVGEIYEEMILFLIRAGMVLTNVNVWKTFAIARDSSDGIDTAMKSSLKTAMTKEKKETWRTAIKYPKKQCSESRNVKKYTKIAIQLNKGFKFHSARSGGNTTCILITNTAQIQPMKQNKDFWISKN